METRELELIGGPADGKIVGDTGVEHRVIVPQPRKAMFIQEGSIPIEGPNLKVALYKKVYRYDGSSVYLIDRIFDW